MLVINRTFEGLYYYIRFYHPIAEKNFMFHSSRVNVSMSYASPAWMRVRSEVMPNWSVGCTQPVSAMVWCRYDDLAFIGRLKCNFNLANTLAF
jgi:hypothetical protein